MSCQAVLFFSGVGQAMGAQNGFGRYPNKGMGESFSSAGSSLSFGQAEGFDLQVMSGSFQATVQLLVPSRDGGPKASCCLFVCLVFRPDIFN